MEVKRMQIIGGIRDSRPYKTYEITYWNKTKDCNETCNIGAYSEEEAQTEFNNLWLDEYLKNLEILSITELKRQ